MVLAMYAGMLGLGALLGATTRDSAPELFTVVMALMLPAMLVRRGVWLAR